MGEAEGGDGEPSPQPYVVTGVVTDGVNPVAGALVMQGGLPPALETGDDGAFELTIDPAVPGVDAVVAGKLGYRSAGEELFEPPTEPIEIVLRFVTPPDNAELPFQDPGPRDYMDTTGPEHCAHCHVTFTPQFFDSAHRGAAKDPLVQDLFAGTTRHTDPATCAAAGGVWRDGVVPGSPGQGAPRCYVGGGVLPDLNPGCGGAGEKACDDPSLDAALKPTRFGGCADCHAPGIDGPLGGRNLHDATGTSYELGVHCDVCHKTADIDLTQPPGVAGALRIQRPRDILGIGEPPLPVFFGPYPDVPSPFMGGSYQPKFSSAEFCAACHEQRQAALVPGESLDAARWPDGLPVHSTFSEWSASAYNQPGSQCQFCHMPEEKELLNSAVLGETGMFGDPLGPEDGDIGAGWVRPPGTVRSHIFRGPLTAWDGQKRLVDGALLVNVTPGVSGGELVVEASVKNYGCGHAVPTGEPMRAVVLLVRATACGAPLAPTGGMTVPDGGGAHAAGTVGVELTLSAGTVTWPAGAARAQVGHVVRFVRPTGEFLEYPAVGFFGDPALLPSDKGMELHAPVAEAKVVAVAGDVLTLDSSPPALPGDVAFLGDALDAWPDADGPSRAVAGAPGLTFSRVLVDSAGRRHVPHHRAVDMVSDNRIPPGATAASPHRFALPAACPTVDVEALALYRPHPLALTRERGHDGKDYLVAKGTQQISLP